MRGGFAPLQGSRPCGERDAVRGICSTRRRRLTELRPDLRTKLAPLLQALLAEAAGVQQRRTESTDRDGEEDGDDQDHA